MNERDRLAASTAEDAKIADIGCDHKMLRVQFAHANQAQVGKIGASIGIAIRQFREASEMRGGIEGRTHQSFTHKRQNQCCVAEMKTGFGEHCLARQQRLG